MPDLVKHPHDEWTAASKKAGGDCPSTHCCPKWEGDLNDDCTLRDGGLIGRVEMLDETETVYVAVYSVNGDTIFHTAECAGIIVGMEMGRKIVEAIIL